MADFYTTVIGARTEAVRDPPPGPTNRVVGKEDAPTYLAPMKASEYRDYLSSTVTNNAQTVHERANHALGWIPMAPPPRPIVNAPNVDTSLTMASEGDVVRAAQLNLIAPVETLIRRIYNLDGNHDNPNPPVPITDFWSTAEESSNDNRTDLAWYASFGGVKRCILVLEFKKRGLLKLNEWLPPMGNQIAPRDWVNFDINYQINASRTPNGAKIDESTNAHKIVKQAVRYQTSFSDLAPKRVLLFDYQTLCVLQFPGIKPANYKKGLGFVWLTETTNDWDALRATNVFQELGIQNNADGGLYLNTIGYKQASGQPNKACIDLAKTMAPTPVAPANPLPDGSFREMLLMCLMDSIENGG